MNDGIYVTKGSLKSWKDTMQATVATGVILSVVASVFLSIMGAIFATKTELEAESNRVTDTRRYVRFVACAVALDVPTCQDAHGITVGELLRMEDGR